MTGRVLLLLTMLLTALVGLVRAPHASATETLVVGRVQSTFRIEDRTRIHLRTCLTVRESGQSFGFAIPHSLVEIVDERGRSLAQATDGLSCVGWSEPTALFSGILPPRMRYFGFVRWIRVIREGDKPLLASGPLRLAITPTGGLTVGPVLDLRHEAVPEFEIVWRTRWEFASRWAQ